MPSADGRKRFRKSVDRHSDARNAWGVRFLASTCYRVGHPATVRGSRNATLAAMFVTSAPTGSPEPKKLGIGK